MWICSFHIWLCVTLADAFLVDVIPDMTSFRKPGCPGVISPTYCHTIMTARSRVACAVRCATDMECASFSWDSNTSLCSLCHRVADSLCANTVVKPGTVGFEMKKPCLNGGEVIENEGSCSCPPNTGITGNRCHLHIIDCDDVFQDGGDATGVYYVHPNLLQPSFQVYCDIRTNYRRTYVMLRKTKPFDFYRPWQQYKKGFGNVAGQNYWLGLDKLYWLTHSSGILFKLYFQLSFVNPGDFKQQIYQNFTVSSPETFYRVHFDYTSSSKNNPLGDCLSDVIGRPFSTYDADHDDDVTVNCAERHHSGFWFGNCTLCNPTGILAKPSNMEWSGDVQDVFWFPGLGNTVPKEIRVYLQRGTVQY